MTTALTDLSPDALANALEANMAKQFAYFRRSPRAVVDESPDLLRFLCGIPIPEYNGVIGARFARESTPDALRGRIDAVVASFAERRQPFLWWVGSSSTPADLRLHLAAVGLASLGEGPGMATDLEALDTRHVGPPGPSIVPVADERTLQDWVGAGRRRLWRAGVHPAGPL